MRWRLITSLASPRNTRETMERTIPLHDVAWLAGILDGEGCLKFQTRNRRSRIMKVGAIRVTNTNIKIITGVRDLLRALVTYPKSIKVYYWGRGMDNIRRNIWTVEVFRRTSIAEILTAVHPHLRGNQNESALMLEWCHYRLQQRKDYGAQWKWNKQRSTVAN